MKKKRRRSSKRSKDKSIRFKRPATARQYFLLSPRNQQIWDSVGHAVSKARNGVSLSKAAQEFGLDRDTVIKFGRPALRKQRNRRYVAKKKDQLLRVVNALTSEGRMEIATRDSRQASLVGGHWAAVQKYLQTGDDSALLSFKGKRVTDARRKRYLLLTDLKELERLGSAGTLRFETIYSGGAR